MVKIFLGRSPTPQPGEGSGVFVCYPMGVNTISMLISWVTNQRAIIMAKVIFITVQINFNIDGPPVLLIYQSGVDPNCVVVINVVWNDKVMDSSLGCFG